MTRRAFLTTPTAGLIRPNLGTSEGFTVTGLLSAAGQDTPKYYAIAQSVALMLDPSKACDLIAGAESLLGVPVHLTLTRA